MDNLHSVLIFTSVALFLILMFLLFFRVSLVDTSALGNISIPVQILT
jgi:hypothetical protein